MLLVRYGKRAYGYVLTHTLYHVKCVLSSQHSTTVPLCWILIHTSHKHTHTVPVHTYTGCVDPGGALPFSFPI